MKLTGLTLLFCLSWIYSIAQPTVSIPLVHDKTICSLDLSENGRLLLSASTDQSVKLWDVKTGALLRTHSVLNSSLLEAHFYKGSEVLLLIGHQDIVLLEWKTGEVLFRITSDSQWMSFDYCLKLDEIATIDLFDNKVKFWSLIEYTKKSTIILENDTLTKVLYEKDGSFEILTKQDDYHFYNSLKKEINRTPIEHVVDIDNPINYSDSLCVVYCQVGEEETYEVKPKKGTFHKCYFHQKSGTLVTLTIDGWLQIYDTRNNRLKYETQKTDYILEIAFNSDVLCVAEDRKIELINLNNGRVFHDIDMLSTEMHNGHFFINERNLLLSNGSDIVLIDQQEGDVNVCFNSQLGGSNNHGLTPSHLTYINNDTIHYWKKINEESIFRIDSLENVEKFSLSATGKYLCFLTAKSLKLLDVKNQTVVFEVKESAQVVKYQFSTNDSLLAVALADNSIRIYDLKKRKRVYKLKPFVKRIRLMVFSPMSDKLVLNFSMNKDLNSFDLLTGKMDVLQGHTGWVYRGQFIDNDRFVSTSRSGEVFLWQGIDGRYEFASLKGHSSRVSKLCLSNDGKYFATGSRDGQIIIWSVENGSKIGTLKGHDGWISSIVFNRRGNLLLSTGYDGKAILWDVNKLDQVCSIYAIDKGYETFIITPDNYYLDKYRTIHKSHFIHHYDVYSFSQFDLKYNRPDIVLERLGYASPEKIKSYRRAYEKRLQKMGFTEDMLKADFHLPEASILNENDIPVQIEGEVLKLNIKATDSKYALDRINVWINNVPIYGVNGISLRDKNAQDYKTEIELQLNEGDNKIEVSVLNQAGAESYKETVYINSTKPTPKPNLYFVGIGVKDYVNEDMNLKFSDKDIRDVVNLYGSSSAYGKVYIDTFLNASATKNILPQIRQRLESTTIHDQVIFMYSGHGILDDSLDYYLTTHDIDIFNPKGKGIPYEAVDELLDNIPARQKLVLIDACNSGEVDKDEMEVDNTTGITAEVVAPKGDMFKKYATKTNSFEMMQELFTDLRRGTGATVISSSSGKYFSFEDKKYQNGVYTYALKLGLEGAADVNGDDEITVSELKEFLYTKVESLTNGKQKPTARQENLEYDFRVW